MALHSAIPAIWLLGLSFLITPRPASGQASDSAPATTSDSQAAADSLARDTLAAKAPEQTADTALNQPGSDTVRADSASAPDTIGHQERRDTGEVQAAGDSEKGDSTLRRSCRNPLGAGVAPDLLVVVFAPEAEAKERAAAAEGVDGRLLGAVPGDPGAYYLRLSSGGEYSLRAASDQLILMAQVRQVGSRSCPPS
jgi:hypothetical protein